MRLPRWIWIVAIGLLLMLAWVTRYRVVGRQGVQVVLYDRWLHRSCIAVPGQMLCK